MNNNQSFEQLMNKIKVKPLKKTKEKFDDKIKINQVKAHNSPNNYLLAEEFNDDLVSLKNKSCVEFHNTSFNNSIFDFVGHTNELVASSFSYEYFDNSVNYKLRRNIKRNKITIDFSVDLHGYNLVEAKQELTSSLTKAKSQNFKFVEIIHGKGSGKMKSNVLFWLEQIKDKLRCIYSIKDITGASGAVVILLKA